MTVARRRPGCSANRPNQATNWRHCRRRLIHSNSASAHHGSTRSAAGANLIAPCGQISSKRANTSGPGSCSFTCVVRPPPGRRSGSMCQADISEQIGIPASTGVVSNRQASAAAPPSTARVLACAISTATGSRSTPITGPRRADACKSPPIPQQKSAIVWSGGNRLAL